MRRTYPQFVRLVERARREVLRETGDPAIQVIAISVEAPRVAVLKWGEFYYPAGPIVIYQLPYEMMPDQDRYYPQIKEVLRHEYKHAGGDDLGEGMGGMPVWRGLPSHAGWTGSASHEWRQFLSDGSLVTITLPGRTAREAAADMPTG